ncbi:MAG TPA: cytochrome c3 family protein [Candidatus Sulfotelmatobacter sp.]|nr:cytochrome c3 family protein [Candidatus Sulfotelmatobacter sp.]
MKFGLRASIACVLLATTAFAVEHPGTIPQDAECSSCHGNKLKGKSVHSAMESPCTVCHVTMVQGDMTTVSLLMPKNKICSACHADSAALRQHVPASNKATCVDCHDAHSSDQKMLLRDVAMLGGPEKK